MNDGFLELITLFSLYFGMFDKQQTEEDTLNSKQKKSKTSRYQYLLCCGQNMFLL